jgi:iron complex transport system ATP-binding protein
MTSLTASAVTASYGPRVVLRDCSFALDSGEIVAIVGPNGAGKSTLLRVLAGLLRPAAGVVSLDGQDLAAIARSQIAHRIAVVPQIFDTLFPFTVREVVGLGRTARLGVFGRASADDVAAVERAISELELEGLAGRRIDRLSGGERQRAVLAMALAQETPVLLLDEPTVHLDPGHQLGTLELLRELAARRRLAVCAVLHDLNLASTFGSRIVALADGRIVRQGTPFDVLDADLVRAVFGEGLEVVARDRYPAVLPLPPRTAVKPPGREH